MDISCAGEVAETNLIFGRAALDGDRMVALTVAVSSQANGGR